MVYVRTKSMKIIADENIPLLMECFGGMGEVIALPGRTISNEDVKDADVLLVRSVTKVNRELVEGSSLKFVATATAGFDHVDKDYLTSQGIAFSHAPGCNATAVTEYVLAALDILSEQAGFELKQRTVGIVGKGQVGGLLYRVMEKLGIPVYASDPFIEAQNHPDDHDRYLPLPDLIQQCDVICLHTPLTKDGQHPSFHLMGAEQLQAMKPGTILINGGRGPVIDNEALKHTLKHRNDLTVVLDVWEHEPDADPELMSLVAIATPHIAGYSLDGKIRGTEMIYKAFCKQFGLPARVRLPAITPLPVLKEMRFNEGSYFSETCSKAIRAVYDIRRDDAFMRSALMGKQEADRKVAFDQLRKEYPQRREFNTLRVHLKDCDSSVEAVFQALNFRMVDEH